VRKVDIWPRQGHVGFGVLAGRLNLKLHAA
jgi:hypothetical protein